MRSRQVPLLAPAVLALAMILTQSVRVHAAEPNRWAILIGIDDYIQAQNLKYCGADQQALKDQLVASGFEAEQVFLLHDKAQDRKYQPTKRNIEKQLELVLSLVDRGDIVVLSFSGHGVHFGGKSYLCPNDAELDDPETLIDTQAIYGLLKGSRASLKVLVVDACRNDPRPSGQRAFKATAGSTALARSFQDEKLTPEGVVLLNSCSPGEISWEEEKFGHGVFMNFVLDGLKGKADRNSDGSVSLSELAKYANLNTKLHVARKYNDSQRPFITNESTLDALDFDFTLHVPQVQDLITNSIGMKLKLIPAGEFQMGSPAGDDEHQHLVRITQAFYLQTTEVTQGQWRAVMGTEPWKGKDYVKEGADYAATYVSWNDAVEFCRKLSLKEGVEYRLPTEAEWEYACRAGSTTMYSFGDNVSGLKDYAWFEENAWDIDEKYAHQVGLKRPNAWGLYDMHGNVYEWCSDWYGEDYYASSPEADPRGPSSGSNRVNRGGSWFLTSLHARSAFRLWYSPGSRNYIMGFRVLRSSVLSVK